MAGNPPFCYIHSDMGFSLKGIGKKIAEGFSRIRREGKPQAEPAETIHTPKLSDEAAELLERLCRELGPRPAASPGSRNAARCIAGIFSSFTDDVTLTSGRIIPGLGRWMAISRIAAAAAVAFLMMIGLPLPAVGIAALFLFSFSAELMRKHNPLRCLFPTDDAANVHAVIEPEGQVERTVVFSCHHDTAPVSARGKGKAALLLSLPSSLAGFAILSLLSVAELTADILSGGFPGIGLPSFPVAAIAMLSAVMCIVPAAREAFGRRGYTCGAGDDLSGVAAVSVLGRYFARRRREGHGLASTRLVFVSFDGEECGAQGSALWFRDNSHILIDPVVLNIDGLYDADDLAFLSQDGNGLVRLSPELAARCSMMASGMGYTIPVGRIGFLGGETDAAAAACSGIASTTVTAMAPGTETAAHTEEDTPDKVSPEAFSRVLSVAIKLAEDSDRKEEHHEAERLLENGRKYRLSRY